MHGRGMPASAARSPAIRLAGRAQALAKRSTVRGPRGLGIALCLMGAVLLPWMAYLAMSLPASTEAYHWSAAWVALDGLEATGFLVTGFLLCRHDTRYILTAVATAAFLVTDALFDVTTASAGQGLRVSIAMAVLAELPGSAICAAIAVLGLRQMCADRDDGLCPIPVPDIGTGGREYARRGQLGLQLARTNHPCASGGATAWGRGNGICSRYHSKLLASTVAARRASSWGSMRSPRRAGRTCRTGGGPAGRNGRPRRPGRRPLTGRRAPTLS